jgi:hypothetical protein
MLSGTSYHILSPIRAAGYNFYKSRGFLNLSLLWRQKRSLEQDIYNSFIFLRSFTWPHQGYIKRHDLLQHCWHSTPTELHTSILKSWCHLELVINESNGAERCLWEKWPLPRPGENGKVRYVGSICIRTGRGGVGMGVRAVFTYLSTECLLGISI